MSLIRRAVVTGGGRGIGRAVALRLASEGADIVVSSRTGDDLSEVVNAIEKNGGSATGVAADLASVEGVDRLAGAVAARWEDGVDVLVNNVGGSRPKPLSRMDDIDWLDALSLNFLSAVRVTSRLVPAMVARRSGSIVNVASMSGREPVRLVASYSAAKAALISYTKSCADEYAGAGVRVNCVLPGLIETSSTHRNALASAAATGKSPEEVMAAMLANNPIPIGRLGTPDDVAATVIFLASDHASFITGAAVDIDGGAHRRA